MSDKKHKQKKASDFHPESLMMSYGYNPAWSEGAIKSPIFQTSTFVFETAEDGKAFFELALGKREKRKGEKIGLIYSRINNPDLEILENRLTVWDKAEECAVFESGMAAISTTLLELLEPGQFILHTDPVYGGTDHFIKHTLHKFGIDALGISPEMNLDDILEMLDKKNCRDKVGMIFIETPANPTNALFDISMLCEVAKSLKNSDRKVYVVVDNTFLGPLWQHPLQLGADIVIYSATKYIGGHSDVIAGAALGSHELILRIKTLRSQLGSMGGPWTGWMLLRSLETLKIRMEKQLENARIVADFLSKQPQVLQVNYLGLLKQGTHYYDIVKKQCDEPGAMISFYLKGGEKEAFRFLNNLKLFKLAVSLGSTESLAEHPASMTHSPLSDEDLLEYRITDNMIRLSIGVEHPDDLIRDLKQALCHI
jgi:methionine-gamma-lyase